MRLASIVTSARLLAMVSVFAAGSAWASTPPDELVRKTTEEILALTKKNRDLYAKDVNQLYKMAEEKVLPYFDFARMSQWVLGKHWRAASPEQRARFTQEFRDLLVRTYSTALLNYTDQQIVYHPLTARPGEQEALVRTEVKQSGGGPNIPINYTFYKGDGGWKVYDVTIEGISLVTNYRSVYANKIKNEGLDGLIANLAESNKKSRK